MAASQVARRRGLRVPSIVAGLYSAERLRSRDVPPFCRNLPSSGRDSGRQRAGNCRSAAGESRCQGFGSRMTNGAGIAADPALADVSFRGERIRRSMLPVGRNRGARASGARAGNRFRRAGSSGPRARGSLSFTATTRRFRSLHIRSGLAISAVPAIHEGLRFTRLFPSGSVGAEAPRFPGTCGLRSVRLAPPFAPTSRDRMIRPNRNEPLAASAVRLDQTRRFVRDVFSDATAGSATVPDGFNGIPLSYQAFRPSSSDGFLRLPMT